MGWSPTRRGLAPRRHRSRCSAGTGWTHLLRLINQVLDPSKIEAGKLELDPQTVQLAPLIDEVIGTTPPHGAAEQEPPCGRSVGRSWHANRGPDAAATILLNLLSNACKFTKEGEVKLRARRVGDGVSLD